MDSLQLLTDRLDRERAAGEVALCDSALKVCEALIKHTAALLVAAVPHSQAREERYLLEHRLLRTSGVGEWGISVRQVAVGALNQVVQPQLREVGASLAVFSESVTGDDWRLEVVRLLDESRNVLSLDGPSRRKTRLLDFYTGFADLRNKLDAHGAPSASTKAEVGIRMERAARLIADNLMVLQLPLVAVRSDLATGAPVSVPMSAMVEDRHHQAVGDRLAHEPFRSGAYLVTDEVVSPVVLMAPDIEARDLRYANGSYRPSDTTAEFLSYSSGAATRVEVSKWSLSPTSVRRSETSGLTELEHRGQTITNAPPVGPGYIPRHQVEELLVESLAGDRRDVVTLKGRGGIGKTTLALEAVRRLCESGTFDLILWFSGRDLDLRETVAVPVHQDILTLSDIDEAVRRLLPQCGMSPMTLEELMSSGEAGRVLCVFDNFETIEDPGEAFATLDETLRRPHKVLITTRHRESRGDFPIDVPGMTQDEFAELVADSTVRLGVPRERVDVDELYRVSEGHPYIAKVLLSELREAPTASMRPALARRDDLLDALFERTIDRLAPPDLHVFLLLCSWKSDVPEVGLDVAVNGVVSEEAIDVPAAIETLVANSLVEAVGTGDDLWIHVPFPAWTFGKRKLKSYPRALDIEMQREILLLLGPVDLRDSEGDIRGAVRSFWKNASEHVGLDSWEAWRPRAERLARVDPDLWFELGKRYEQVGDDDSAEAAYRQSIEANADQRTWHRLARLYERRDDDPAALNAWVRRATAEGASAADASHAANKVNGWLARGRVEVSPGEQRRLLVEPLIAALEAREAELEGKDFGRLAWLYVHAGDPDQGVRAAQRGLEREAGQEHCESFLNRFR